MALDLSQATSIDPRGSIQKVQMPDYMGPDFLTGEPLEVQPQIGAVIFKNCYDTDGIPRGTLMLMAVPLIIKKVPCPDWWANRKK